ncbi:MAG: DMT family transporter [Rhodobacterales bacterium]|nr:DMT family transporter [Rhodobacterales bacterium]
MTEPTNKGRGPALVRDTLTPALFVVLWSTGFIGAKLGLPHAEPFTFLFLRFAILAVLLTVVALVLRAPWPADRAAVGRMVVAGLMVHGAYLGGVFAGIHWGVPAGLAALIVGVQPLLTAVAAGPVLGERVTGRQWLGLMIGLAGVVLVLWDKLSLNREHAVGVAFCLFALVGITAGTLYQKRHGAAMDLRTGSAIQFAAAAVPMGLLALAFETRVVEWTGSFIFALAWLVVVLSLGAISLLYILIRRGAASKVASLFYLVPPVTAVIAYFLFGETLGPAAILGMGLAVVGVALVTKG